MSTDCQAWHALAVAEVLERLDSRAEGLGAAESARRLAKHGPNVLPRGKVDGPFRIFLRQFNDPLIWVLLGSGVLAVLLGKATDSAAVFAVVVVNAVIGFLPEWLRHVAENRMIIYSLLLIVVMIARPQGLFSLKPARARS